MKYSNLDFYHSVAREILEGKREGWPDREVMAEWVMELCKDLFHAQNKLYGRPEGNWSELEGR